MARNATQQVKKSRSTSKRDKNRQHHKGHRDIDIVKRETARGRSIENIEDMPASGKYCCPKCDLYFRDEHTLARHSRTKAHKKRLREWTESQHTAQDAERAAGLF